ncbi:hypothetical protein FB03_01160 [Actinotignum schaalii]|nr:hypothetical protein FB03_01160 [Actinotignum schaalii]
MAEGPEVAEARALDAAQAEEIQRIARRRMIAAAIVGVILLIVMFFAGRALRQHLAASDVGTGEPVAAVAANGYGEQPWNV